MEYEGWISGCKVQAFPWIDGKRIFFNVWYYRPGQSLERPPVWDKTIYVTDNEAGRRLVFQLTHSLVEWIMKLKIPKNAEFTITT